MVDAFGASRVTIKPPERGIFPLDHEQECKENMKYYISCLKDNKYDHIQCRDYAKKYFLCRMESKNNLMYKEDLNNLGMGENDKLSLQLARPESSNAKELEGYLAGLEVRPGKSWFSK